MVTTMDATPRLHRVTPMARPEKAEKTKQMRFRADLLKMLGVIANERDQDIPDLTDHLFRQIIEREYRASVERLNKSIQPKK